LGNPSTPLNAGQTTNFIFKIVGAKLSQQEISDINVFPQKARLKTEF